MLNNYFKQQASQDVKRKLAACFVLIDEESLSIMGYYTLSNNSIPLDHFPENIQKKFPKSYNSIPTTLLGRLAIDKKYQGFGIGKILLIDADMRKPNELYKAFDMLPESFLQHVYRSVFLLHLSDS